MERQQQHPPTSVVVIGAGPAGLTAGYELTTRGVPVVILEKDSDVGGLARTVEYKGFRFDIGGHRFFTKVGPGARVWRQMLGKRVPAASPPLAHLLSRPLLRLPTETPERAAQPGHLDQRSCVARQLPLDQDVSDTAGAQLCRLGVESLWPHALSDLSSKTYTEKVWGIPCDRIGAQWAAQRIKGLSLRTAVINMLVPHGSRSDATIKSLIEEFDYPRLGPGMMWDAFRDAYRDRRRTSQARTAA